MAYSAGFKTAVKSSQFKANYKEVLRKIDAMSVLEHYGARNIREQPGRNGNEIIHSCLIDTVHPHHSNGDESPSASMNADELMYNCWSYGGGNILWFVQEMEGISDRNRALDILANFITDTDELPEVSLKETLKKMFDRNVTKQPIPRYSDIILEPWLALHPYMTERRNFDPDVLMKYKIGYDEEYEQIVIPHYWKGSLVGYQKRRLDDPEWPTSPIVDKWNIPIPKYKNSVDFPRDQTFYNYDAIRERKLHSITVVESPMSVLRAETLLAQGHTEWNNVIATFGGALTSDQLEVLREFDEIVLMMDNDKSGWHGTVTAFDNVKDYARISIVDVPEGIDLADIFDADDASELRNTKRIGSLEIGKYRKRLEKR